MSNIHPKDLSDVENVATVFDFDRDGPTHVKAGALYASMREAGDGARRTHTLWLDTARNLSAK